MSESITLAMLDGWESQGGTGVETWMRNCGPVSATIFASRDGECWGWNVRGKFNHTEDCYTYRKSREEAARQVIYYLRDIKAHAIGLDV